MTDELIHLKNSTTIPKIL